MRLDLKSPESTSKFHGDVVQMLIIPTPVTLSFPSQPVPIASWGVPYDQLTEEEKSRAWFIDGSAQHADTTLKTTVTALQPLSGTFLKDSGEGDSSQWAELWAVLLVVHFAWKKKWPHM